MKTQDIDIKKFLPLFMRDDEFNIAASNALNDVFQHIDTMKLRTWDNLNSLNHEELDTLANELNVLWYNAAGSLAEKREQIRTSDDVWRTLGTRHAVETVVSQLFGSGTLYEFWEYEGGKPHHFKIDVPDPAVLTAAGEKEFLRVLELVKRKSQILDMIKLVMLQKFHIYLASIAHDIAHEKISITVNLDNEFIGPNVYTGMSVMDSTIERHRWPS